MPRTATPRTVLLENPHRRQILLMDWATKFCKRFCLYCFDDSPCLEDDEDQAKLTRLFPQMAKIAGSPQTLRVLFCCIGDDDSAHGTNIQRNLRQIKKGNAGAYILKALDAWLSEYREAIDNYADEPEEEEDAATDEDRPPGNYGDEDEWQTPPPPPPPPPTLKPTPKPTPAPPPPPPEPAPEPEPDPEEIAVLASITLLKDAFENFNQPSELGKLAEYMPQLHARVGSAEQFEALKCWIRDDPSDYCVKARSLLMSRRESVLGLRNELPDWISYYARAQKLSK